MKTNLVEANSNEGEGMLGPSHVFYSDLIEEAEDGSVVQVGRKASIVIVDLSDEALEGMREYDPVTDSTAHFCPFDEEKASAIVNLKDIDEAVRSWVDGIASGRQNFYSAREEPSVPKATPKKQAKRLSNAALADQVAHLVAQMQLLASQQQEMRESFLPTSSAIPADVGLSGKSQPAVSWSSTSSQGGSSKVHPDADRSAAQDASASCVSRCSRCGGRERARRSFRCRKQRSYSTDGLHQPWLSRAQRLRPL